MSVHVQLEEVAVFGDLEAQDAQKVAAARVVAHEVLQEVRVEGGAK